MAFLIGGANSAADTGYDIENSLRFENADSAMLDITHGTPTSTRIGTFSFWTKRCNLGAYQYYLATQNGNGTDRDGIAISDTDDIDFRLGAGDSSPIRVKTNAKLRDPSAWYHIVVALDTTQGTEANRVKIYINGTLQTSLATSDYPDQNYDYALNVSTGERTSIGDDSRDSASSFLDAYLAEFFAIDGTQYAASDFGETDSSGIWIPKDCKDDLTFGNSGFYMEFKQTGTSANASGKGADTSGNGNHFDDNNLTANDQMIDTPTNNFCTLNPLVGANGSSQTAATSAFSEGNLVGTIPPTNGAVGSTIALPLIGKWYAEFRFDSAPGYAVVGVSAMHQKGWNDGQQDDPSAQEAYCYGLDSPSVGPGFGEIGTIFSTGTQSGDEIQMSEDNVFGLLWDADNVIMKLTDGTDTFQRAYTFNDTSVAVGFFFACSTAGSTGAVKVNFGSDSSFAGEETRQGNTDANDQGDFFLSVPTGFHALCTKNLAEFGG